MRVANVLGIVQRVRISRAQLAAVVALSIALYIWTTYTPTVHVTMTLREFDTAECRALVTAVEFDAGTCAPQTIGSQPMRAHAFCNDSLGSLQLFAAHDIECIAPLADTVVMQTGACVPETDLPRSSQMTCHVPPLAVSDWVVTRIALALAVTAFVGVALQVAWRRVRDSAAGAAVIDFATRHAAALVEAAQSRARSAV
jgi:hypothetical protein